MYGGARGFTAVHGGSQLFTAVHCGSRRFTTVHGGFVGVSSLGFTGVTSPLCRAECYGHLRSRLGLFFYVLGIIEVVGLHFGPERKLSAFGQMFSEAGGGGFYHVRNPQLL